MKEISNESIVQEWMNYKNKRRSNLINTNFSIIASNCCGTIMYHDLDLPYLSPTINLSFNMKDFVKMVKKLKEYLAQEIIELQEDYFCPVGMLGDVRINFVHYESFEDAVSKWEERKRRINWENLFIVGVEKDECVYETIKEFEYLPYKNKVIFTHTEYPEFASAYCIKGFEERDEIGVLTNYKSKFPRRRYIDDFDYVSFFNGQGVH